MMHRNLLALPAAALLSTFAFGQCAGITTLTNGNNGQNGTTFDIVNLDPVRPMTIVAFEQCWFAAGTSDVEIYTKTGTSSGFEQNAAVWTLAATASNVNHGQAPTLDAIPVLLNVVIPPGATQGFCITSSTGDTVNYSTGVNQFGSVIGSDSNLEIRAGAGIIYPFAGSFGLPTAGRLWNGRVTYCPPGAVYASVASVGTGCGAASASIYEHFTTTPSIDLSNSAFQLLNTGNGYLVLPSSTPFVPPSGTATNLGLTDDSETTVNLSAPLNYPGGTTTSLNVCSNGHVSVATNLAEFEYQPIPATMLAWPNATWAVWRDLIPDLSGNVWFEEANGIAYITWLNVVGYNGQVAGTVTSTFQFQFQLASGNVEFVFGNLDTTSISTWTNGDGWVVGYKPDGIAQNPGSVDLTTALPISLPAADRPGLELTTAQRPIVNTTVNLVARNITPTTPFGAVAFGLIAPPAPLNLAGVGMPGCFQYHDILVTQLYLPFGANSATVPFQVPNLVGLPVRAQAYNYDPAAGLTPLGAVSSNSLTLRAGDS
jgi:hypothetical protein